MVTQLSREKNQANRGTNSKNKSGGNSLNRCKAATWALDVDASTLDGCLALVSARRAISYSAHWFCVFATGSARKLVGWCMVLAPMVQGVMFGRAHVPRH